MPPKPYKFSFSYSRWSLYSKCPKAFKLKNVDKIDTGPTPPALLKGRKVHDDAANYLMGKTDEMPQALTKFSILANDIRSLPADKLHIEEQMAFDKQGLRTTWFGPTTYYRFTWDVGIETSPQKVDAVDWKTGKRYDSYDDQQQLFALPAFWINPNLEEFTGHWCYLDTGEVDSVTFNRQQAQHLSQVWAGNAAMMEADKAFLPKPSKSACRFCDFGPNKMNICEDGVA